MTKQRNPTPPRADTAFQWLGLSGVVLLAALICDFAVVVPTVLGQNGELGRNLVLLPAIGGMAICALWARSRPAVAIFAGAGILIISSAFIDTTPYSILLANISFTEIVAGFELIFFCVRRVRAGVAVAGVVCLVVACLLAITGRNRFDRLGNSLLAQTLIFGFLLLIIAVIAGLYRRNPDQRRQSGTLAKMLREQWPLVGILSVTLFFELAMAYESGVVAFPLLLCSIGAATVVLLGVRRPDLTALGVTGLLLVSALITPVLRSHLSEYLLPGGIPPTQIAAGMAVVTYLIRSATRARGWIHIGILSSVVVFAAVLNADPRGLDLTFRPDQLQLPAIAAFLLLGISIATGMYLKSRDSEQAQVMQSAVTDAQTSERMALARELHDVVAHHVTGIVVQAQAARMMGEKNPEIALEAMERIENAGTEALAAMRRLVRSMRGDTPSGSSEFSEQATTDLVADLHRLVDGANHGVVTELDIQFTEPVPPEVSRSALRIVQESLTNVGKHAAKASKAVVLVEIVGGKLHLWIRDFPEKNPRRNPTPAKESDDTRRPAVTSGYGLIGMRERVELLHGRLTAGPGKHDGWQVDAWLPLEGAE